MSTYWTVNGEYNGRSGWGGPCRDTREEALSAGFQDASYYLLECGYGDVSLQVEEHCSTCHGEGTIRVSRPRSAKTKKCPDCKGHVGPLSVIGPIPVALHCNAQHRAQERATA